MWQLGGLWLHWAGAGYAARLGGRWVFSVSLCFFLTVWVAKNIAPKVCGGFYYEEEVYLEDECLDKTAAKSDMLPRY